MPMYGTCHLVQVALLLGSGSQPAAAAAARPSAARQRWRLPHDAAKQRSCNSGSRRLLQVSVLSHLLCSDDFSGLACVRLTGHLSQMTVPNR